MSFRVCVCEITSVCGSVQSAASSVNESFCLYIKSKMALSCYCKGPDVVSESPIIDSVRKRSFLHNIHSNVRLKLYLLCVFETLQTVLLHTQKGIFVKA